MKHKRKNPKRDLAPTSAPRTYVLEPLTGLWIDNQGRKFRLDTHGTHTGGNGQQMPNRLDLVPTGN